jgi:hypothetical protein
MRSAAAGSEIDMRDVWRYQREAPTNHIRAALVQLYDLAGIDEEVSLLEYEADIREAERQEEEQIERANAYDDKKDYGYGDE